VAILTLWNGRNGLGERQGRRLLATLTDLGLFKLMGEAPQRQMTMHDLQHDYLRAVAGENLGGLHDRLLSAYKKKCSESWSTSPRRPERVVLGRLKAARG
jgi:hypothetical protein